MMKGRGFQRLFSKFTSTNIIYFTKIYSFIANLIGNGQCFEKNSFKTLLHHFVKIPDKNKIQITMGHFYEIRISIIFCG